MGTYVIKLPDIGEGVAEAELVEWLVEPGQQVKEDDPLAAVMTDKATVEIPSPVAGKIAWLGAAIGEIVAVGTEIIRLEVSGEGNVSGQDPRPEERGLPVIEKKHAAQGTDGPVEQLKAVSTAPQMVSPPSKTGGAPAVRPTGRLAGEKPVASPAVRERARALGIDLRYVGGSGPAGRITHDDLDAFNHGSTVTLGATHGRIPDLSVKELKVVGLRRKIAEKMTTAKSRIPHITYIEEVDVTELESLRQALNAARRPDQIKLTLLPFLMQAMLVAIRETPQINARFDDEAGVVYQFGGVHFGIATQTTGGLVVPVLRHSEALGLWEMAAQLAQVTSDARDGKATREALSGSTITITSLGALGGLATTPVINHPEVAIVGVNKIRTAPVWDGRQFQPRQVMNLSSSFDHRIIDGWDAALFVQRIKTLLETPALIFIGA